MLKFKLVVDNPNPNGDSVEKEFEWPVVPRKGELLNIAPKGYTGSFAVVEDVQHWLGCDDIDVKCRLTEPNAVEAFEELKKEGFSHH